MESETTPSPLTDRQLKLLTEMVRTNDIKAACSAAGIGRTSAYRWLQQETFSNELTRMRSTTMNEALNSIKSLTTQAATVLAALLESKNESIRRMVCRDILRHAVKIREMEEVEQRIDRLEDTMKKMNRRH